MLDLPQADHVIPALTLESPGRPGIAVHLCSLHLTRLAGLPVSCVQRLAAEDLIARLNEAEQLEHLIGKTASALADELHEAVGAVKDAPELKAEARALIEAKRSVFNGKRVKQLDTALAALDRLRPEGGALLRRWVELASLLDSSRQAMVADWETNVGAARRALRDAAGAQAFADSLALVNPELHAQVAAFRDAASDAVRHKDRQVEASLHQFVTRTATKTSPLSRLCTTAYGLIRPAEDRQTRDDVGLRPTVSRVRLNLGLLARLRDRAEALLAKDALLPIVLNSTVSPSGGDRFSFLRTRLRPVQHLAVFSSVTTQGMFSVPRTPVSHALAQMLAGGASLTVGECLERLADRGVGGARAATEIAQLLERGFLETASARGLGDYRSGMARTKGALEQAGLTAMAAPLERMDRLSEEIGASSGSDRVALLREARSVGRVLCDEAGIASVSNAASVLYEDTILEGRADAPWAQDRRLLDALGALAPVLPLLDGLLPTRLAVREAFIRQFGEDGTCLDVGLFADDIARLRNATHAEETGSLKARTPIDHALMTHASPERRAEMRKALGARRAAYLHLRRQALRAGGGTLSVAPEELAQFIESVPRSAHLGLASAAVFLQSGGPGEWVVNQISAGCCQFMSRFVDHWALEGDHAPLEAARAYLRRVTPPDAVFAEIAGHDDSTLNLHPSLTAATIRIPHDRQSNAADEELTLRDLCIRYDASSGSLRLLETASGRQVLPIYLGGLSSALLPALQQLLLLLGPTMRLPRLGWANLLADEGADDLRCFPEVRVGPIVLFRRSWMLPAETLAPPPGLSELDTFDAVRRWRRRSGVPSRCFAVLPEREEKQWRGSAWSKPSFVDFDSPHSVAWLVKATRAAEGHVFLSDALPDPGAALPHARTSEFIIDLTIGANHEPHA